MKTPYLVLVLLLIAKICLFADFDSEASARQTRRAVGPRAEDIRWGSGQFRGLVVGRSTSADMRLVLGPPDSTDQATTVLTRKWVIDITALETFWAAWM
jgi:hypothetical protein